MMPAKANLHNRKVRIVIHDEVDLKLQRSLQPNSREAVQKSAARGVGESERALDAQTGQELSVPQLQERKHFNIQEKFQKANSYFQTELGIESARSREV